MFLSYYNYMYSDTYPIINSINSADDSNNKTQTNSNPLDIIRINYGIKNLNIFFYQWTIANKNKIIDLINMENLTSASLFALKNSIKELSLIESLNSKNKIAIQIMDEILGENKALVSNFSFCDCIETVHSVLIWILKTGADSDGITDEFDKILDITSLLLTRIYKDISIMPLIVNMIFHRYKEGFFIDDLVWAIFELKTPYSLILIANKLQSEDPSDIKLACKLLGFIPGINSDSTKEIVDKYEYFLKWMEENYLYIYYTGENFQQLGNPRPFAINLGSKYLRKIVSTDTGNSIEPLTEKETGLLEEFKELDLDTKVALADFSFKTFKENRSFWEIWINNSISKQISISKNIKGVGV